ncbi:loss of heterozygosity 12 chromosomal region 1 protein homolog [Plakobranchus ocellatus]|uniref:BLOC-1-related complex subunit 5 n=1 Tax=Plakobranchus ocellatus TaxID=259542 RepID=A0AAV4C7C2_9GAST|nr:loss of heterozygosity 12 chromosomal region 1 protein homolog [Plakobranchus ocellatus]
MGSDQSTLPAGAPGSNLRSQRDEEIPYTQYSISKPIDTHSPRQSPRPQKPQRPVTKQDKDGTPKHEIVVVADGQVLIKDPDPELTKLNTIPVFFPILRGSLNIPAGSKETEILDKLDHKQVLQLSLRYQDHLRQLSEAVAFDQNALCIRIKEIDHTIHVLNNTLLERQKKYGKFVEQFGRVTETLSTLKKIQKAMDDIVPRMDILNSLLPESEQLESFSYRSSRPASRP